MFTLEHAGRALGAGGSRTAVVLRAMTHRAAAVVPSLDGAGKAFAFALSGPARAQFCRMAEDYVQYHLGRGFDSLRFYHSVALPQP